MAAYLTFLLDLSAQAGDRIVDQTLAFSPDPATVPTTAFQWKVTRDARGVVVIRAHTGAGLSIIATARWHDALSDRQQRDSTPTTFQWDAVATALASAAAKRAIDPTPPDDTLVDDGFEQVAGDLRDPPPELASALAEKRAEIRAEKRRQAQARERRQRPGGVKLLLGLGVVIAASVGVYLGVRHSARKRPAPAPGTSEPVGLTEPAAAPAEPAPPTAVEPAPPAVEPAPPTAVEPATPVATAPADPAPATIAERIARADSLAAAMAIAKPELAAVADGEVPDAAELLAGYRVRWSDVEGASATSIARVEKDPQAEQGKRLCASGAIEHITKRTVGGRTHFVGALRTADGDRLAFLAAGSTGDLLKRDTATFCGVVTGTTDGVASAFGMFDLPENRNPVVERP